MAQNGAGRPPIIVIANHKGGVGKTTTAISLGSALAERGRRVLLVDLDPQFTLTRGVGVDPETTGRTIRDVLLDGQPLAAAIRPGVLPGVDLAPADLELATADLRLAEVPAGDLRLRRAFEDHDWTGYDLVVIDTPPSLGRLTINALGAASHLLVPVDSAPWAGKALARLFAVVTEVQRYLNRGLVVLGILLTKYQAHVPVAQHVRSDLARHWPDGVLEATIRLSSKLVEAAYVEQPISRWDRRSPVASDYRALAEEVERRVQQAR